MVDRLFFCKIIKANLTIVLILFKLFRYSKNYLNYLNFDVKYKIKNVAIKEHKTEFDVYIRNSIRIIRKKIHFYLIQFKFNSDLLNQ